MTRALGDLFTKQISSGVIPDPYVCPPITLSEGEGAFLVVASDGVIFFFFFFFSVVSSHIFQF